jgi:hypothetical protein
MKAALVSSPDNLQVVAEQSRNKKHFGIAELKQKVIISQDENVNINRLFRSFSYLSNLTLESLISISSCTHQNHHLW